MSATEDLNLPSPNIVPVLDPGFRPAVLANREFQNSLKNQAVPVMLGLEREQGAIYRHQMGVAPAGHPSSSSNLFYLERLLKFLLWSRGGWRIYFGGPPELGKALQMHFQESSTGQFDAELMGNKVYGQPFEVVVMNSDPFPPAREVTAPLGRHWNGCRIGFDLGASDRKVAAVQEGKVVFSEETPWDPKSFTDPQQHFNGIMDSLKKAAAHLPRVDAIGGSSAGVYVNNEVRVASLFRGVPEKLFNARVKPLFFEIKKAWNDVPLEVVNDGEVTALAGAMSLEDNAVLGVAMGSSEAAGYVTPEGQITSWLNELAFAPVDFSPNAPVDEWSGDRGCGAQYFSQQCVGRLLKPAGITLEDSLTLPEKLVKAQELMVQGDERAAKIYQTIGVYLGYAIPHYAEFYDFKHLLLLGRVTSGPGGEIIIDQARNVLKQEFPELVERISLRMPGEKEKRHGQAMAAASLPVIP